MCIGFFSLVPSPAPTGLEDDPENVADGVASKVTSNQPWYVLQFLGTGEGRDVVVVVVVVVVAEKHKRCQSCVHSQVVPLQHVSPPPQPSPSPTQGLW